MLTTHPFTGQVQVHLQANPRPQPNAAMEAQVDVIWQQEQNNRQAQGLQPLFNGATFCVQSYAGNQIYGHRSEYRYWLAQYLHSELFPALQLRPLAVSGLLLCADGVVFGKRSASNTTGAEHWELIPSGGIDPQATQIGEQVDLFTPIQTEFVEESGCAAHFIQHMQPFCLVDNHATHSIDIGIILLAPSLTFATLLTQHQHTNQEYTQLELVPIACLAEYVRQQNQKLVSISQALVNRYLQLSD